MPAPSCPSCGLNSSVEGIGKPVRVKDEYAGGDGQSRLTSFHCGDCNLVFDGTDQEWRGGTLGGVSLRERRAKHADLRAQLEELRSRAAREEAPLEGGANPNS